MACIYALAAGVALLGTGWCVAMLTVARRRAILIGRAVILPVGFLIIQRATLYDGIRHVLFVIPMLAILAGLGWQVLLPKFPRRPRNRGGCCRAYVGGIAVTLAALHPPQYVAMNALVGGTQEPTASSSSITGRRLRPKGCGGSNVDLIMTRPFDGRQSAEHPDGIPWREQLIDPMLRRPWIVETDPDHADFIIATERSRCADNQRVVLIDEVKRFDRTFAWVYARRGNGR